MSASQISEKSILDFYNRQTYLGNSYCYPLPTTTIATTSETPLLLFINPTYVPATQISAYFTQRKLVTRTASDTATLNFYFNPTVSVTGTAKLPVNLRIGNSNTALTLVYLSPTVSANGTLVGSLDSSAFSPNQSDKLWILQPNQSLLVTVIVSANNTNVASEISWYELSGSTAA
jgi:hypothetical protein